MVLVAPYFFLYDPEGGRRMLDSAGERSLAVAKLGLSISYDRMTGLLVQVFIQVVKRLIKQSTP